MLCVYSILWKGKCCTITQGMVYIYPVFTLFLFLILFYSREISLWRWDYIMEKIFTVIFVCSIINMVYGKNGYKVWLNRKLMALVRSTRVVLIFSDLKWVKLYITMHTIFVWLCSGAAGEEIGGRTVSFYVREKGFSRKCF